MACTSVIQKQHVFVFLIMLLVAEVTAWCRW